MESKYYKNRNNDKTAYVTLIILFTVIVIIIFKSTDRLNLIGYVFGISTIGMFGFIMMVFNDFANNRSIVISSCLLACSIVIFFTGIHDFEKLKNKKQTLTNYQIEEQKQIYEAKIKYLQSALTSQ